MPYTWHTLRIHTLGMSYAVVIFTPNLEGNKITMTIFLYVKDLPISFLDHSQLH